MTPTMQRTQKLRQKLDAKEIDAMLIAQPANRRYLSGFDGSAGSLLITRDKAILATDFRYIEQASIQAPDYEIFPTKGDIEKWLPEILSPPKIKSLGFEAGHLTFGTYQSLSDILNREPPRLKLVPVANLVESLRAVKEPAEIELIAKAAAITDDAFAYTEDLVYAGISEGELAWAVEKFLRENGSEALPFEIIIASGANAARPHARPSERFISPGEPVVIDIGARVGGYCSDLSRTICLGNRDDTFRRVYDVVLSAQEAALSQIEAGMTGGAADRIAREVIEKAGYGDFFGHGLGHGVGLEPHELPHLGPGATEEIINGMVFTIEPGIYRSGWGGVRIEDLAVMEKGKLRVISKARR